MKCEICGKEIQQSQYANKVLCSGKCFNENFWKEIIAEKDEHIVIHEKCYYDAGDVESPSDYNLLGFSGRRFWIRFFDGREVTTNNLRYQGEIPKEFRDELPNTATFYIPQQD